MIVMSFISLIINYSLCASILLSVCCDLRQNKLEFESKLHSRSRNRPWTLFWAGWRFLAPF